MRIPKQTVEQEELAELKRLESLERRKALETLAAQLSPEFRAQLAVQVLLAYDERRTSEIHWRGAARDTIAAFACVVSGAMIQFGAAMFGTIPLFFLATFWLQHDRRIGRAATFQHREVEPQLQMLTGVEGFEQYLYRTERSRVNNIKWTFSYTVARLFFPTLQLGTMIWGVWFYLVGDDHRVSTMAAVALLVVFELALTFLTGKKVEHIRKK